MVSAIERRSFKWGDHFAKGRMFRCMASQYIIVIGAGSGEIIISGESGSLTVWLLVYVTHGGVLFIIRRYTGIPQGFY
jgi:hypothetical protein